MNKELFSGFKKNKKQRAVLDNAIEKLYDRLDDVPVVSGKVSASSSSFPYIEGHVTVQMTEPKESDKIKKRIREKEKQRDALTEKINTVLDFIENMPVGINREIFEMVYLDDMTMSEVGNAVGYTKGRVSQIISEVLKD